jgi:Ca2+-binding EF-hand superfamily protein
MKIRSLFEKELKNKLALKSSGKSSEENLIVKAFKYFDLDNSGECSPDEFVKAIAKLGVTGFDSKQLQQIFDSYDANKNGELDYKEFAACLYNEDDEEEDKPKKEADDEISDEVRQKLHNSKIMDKFRTIILRRGGNGILGLARQFKIFDDNNSKTLDLAELTKAIKDFQVDLSPSEVKILFNILDSDGTGEIQYDEFLREIRGDMNQKRKALVDQAFNKLDKDRSGVIDFDEIASVYNCKKHPDVISGKKTEKEVYQEFMSTFQLHAQIKGKGTVDDNITREEFQEYYENISASIDRDDYFELMMTNCWKLGKPEAYEGKKAWANEDSSKGGFKKNGDKPSSASKAAGKTFVNLGKKTSPFAVDDSVGFDGKKKNETPINDGDSPIEKFRAVLARRGVRGIMSVRRSFMIADDNNNKTIEFEEFFKLCKDYRIPIEDSDIKALFREFDIDRSGSIDYDEFLRGIMGKMNKRRLATVKKAFIKLDKNGNGKVELDDIRGVYNASKHPDVKSGKKTEEEVLGEFLDVFEYHFNLLNNNKSKDRSITLEEFNEYYNNISMSIDNDDYFDLVLNNAWDLDGSRVTKKGWKADDDIFKKKK